MSPAWTFMLAYLTIVLPATGYTLPLVDQSSVKDYDAKSLREYNSSSLIIKYQRKWDMENGLDDASPSLIRMIREIADPKSEKFTKPPMEMSTDAATDVELLTKAPNDKVYTKALLSGDETTTLSKVEHTTKEKQTAETTHVDKSQTDAITDKSQTDAITKVPEIKFKSTEKIIFTTSLKQIEDSSAFTKSKPMEMTTLSELQSTDDQHKIISGSSTIGPLVENKSSFAPTKVPSKPSPSPILSSTSTELVTTPGHTTGKLADVTDSSTTSRMVTHISTTSAASEANNAQTVSLMKQCMVTILILAIVCTIFIITTIALAAKLSTMRQKRELRHPASYTEMRCISTLLPDSDQMNKANAKRLKTFAATSEESDGDNTTLNSFLPDH
ncbi:P-selectin glycoprotein ligand 1 [Hyperolius riggenbachi]|uniref:P-selectin glycoprotein ligand 1 n=1 Tax=Hyperolius riggenbachi TaxID=752182 RepID=UPI0035A2BD19